MTAALNASTGKVVTPGDEQRSEPNDDDEARSAAFLRYLVHGEHGMTDEQRSLLEGADAGEFRAMGTDVDESAGFLVPALFRNKIIEALEAFGGIRSLADPLNTDSGASMLYPTSDQTAKKGRILAEGNPATEDNANVGQKELISFTYTSDIMRISRQLLQDNAYDLAGKVPGMLGERIARAQAEHWAIGDDTGEPQGLVVGRDTARDVELVLAGEVTFDELVDLEHVVNIAYRRLGNCGWLMSDTVHAAVQKLKDSNGDPIYQRSIAAGTPDRLLGYPITIDDDLPAKSATAGDVQVLFGDFRKAYVIRDVTGVAVLRLAERYAEFNQVGFVSFVRADGMVQDTGAYAAIIN